MTATVEERVELRALAGLPIIAPGDDVGALVADAVIAAGVDPRDGDALVVTSKIVSRAEGRFVDLSTVVAGEPARQLAARTDKDPRLVELILRESVAVSRATRGVLIVRHRLGFVSANAAIDASNAAPPDAPRDTGPWVLLIPEDPDASAARIRATVRERLGVAMGVIVSDSLGRPFRIGAIGSAIGLSGFPAIVDLRGRPDLFGRPLEHTIAPIADQVAAAADLVAGQAGESRPVIHVRGLRCDPVAAATARELQRPSEQDLYV